MEPSFAWARKGEDGCYVTSEGLYGRFHEADGTRVVVNYGATPFAFEGRAVPPGDWRRFDR